MNKEIKDIMNELGKRAVEVVQDKLDPKSDLYRSVGYRIATNGDLVELFVEANDYFIFVDQGRSKGKYPPIAAIESWLKSNGEDISAAFPIARSIANKGIEGKGITDDLVNMTDTSFTSFLNDNISQALLDELDKLFAQ